MSLAETPLVVMLVGVIAYAVLGGADFGAGFWQLNPGHGARERAIRDHARHAITPVWEANHVWLILVLTVCWTCYPTAFGAIASTLAAPLSIAALGIVARATAYVLRGETDSPRTSRAVEILSAASSIVVPFALGAAVGGIASGRVPPGNAQGDLLTSWVNWTSAAIGVLAVASTIYIAAVWLAGDAARIGREDLVEAYRVRALWAAIVAGGTSFAALIAVREDAPRLWHGLTTWPGLGAVVVSAVAGLAALALVASHRLERARVVSAVAVAAVIAGWALAQRPEILPGLSIDQAAAGRATLVAVLVGLAVGSLILVPSLALLFRMVLQGAFDTSSASGAQPLAPAPRSTPAEPGRSTAVCVLGLVAGALVLVVGDAAWSLAIGAGLLLVSGACGFVVVARSLASTGT